MQEEKALIAARFGRIYRNSRHQLGKVAWFLRWWETDLQLVFFSTEEGSQKPRWVQKQPTPQPLLAQCTTPRPVECIITLPCGLCSHHLPLPLGYELYEGRGHLSLGPAQSPASGTGSGLKHKPDPGASVSLSCPVQLRILTSTDE